MKRFLMAVVLFSVLCFLQSCGSYHRLSTGDNVSVPVVTPADALPTS